MITFKELLHEASSQQFTNWIRPSDSSLDLEYKVEYLFRKDSWDSSRCLSIGHRTPLFNSVQEFKQQVNSSPIKPLSEALDGRIMNRSQCTTLQGLQRLVNGYLHPRDVQGIIHGFKTNQPMELPIVICGSKGMFIFSGNTRLDICSLLGVPKKAIFIG